ncbi:phage holin family protein [Chryseobacterium sp. CCH4-E10]|jgi:phage-related holin|uniref:phage holin family protein n=1 Tax=Chryseobacterium sp. CCH4-E10 TaxID=1768758 RepID=UPI0008365C0B|nr:phage holin family protein [Chryseobacterium sp. CCH4-E10]
MKELNNYKKPFLAIATAVKKPAVAIPAIGLASFSDLQLCFMLLLGLMLGDFISGVLASWNLWKNSKIESNFWKYGFSSMKIRNSIAKSVSYFLLIVLSYYIEKIFRIKSFGKSTYTDHDITLTLIAIVIPCAIEFYSIFFENLPKAGFDIWGYFKKITDKIKVAVSTINSLKNGDNSPK